MRTSICKLKRFFFLQPFSNRWLALVAAALILPSLMRGAGTTLVTTMAGGQPGLFYGYRDGSTLHSSLYHTPCGLAISPALNCLFVADRDNNVMRYLDLAAGLTWTLDEPTNTFRQPVGVVVDDSSQTIYVLNRGGGTNGSVVELDNYGEFISTNATKLTNANAITMDYQGVLYVTAFTNTILKIIPGGSVSTLITIANPGTVLQGIVARANGTLAVCDSGRNGIYNIDPVALTITTNAGFHGIGDFTTNGNDVAFASRAMFNGPMGICETGDGNLLVTDITNNRVKVVLPSGVVTNLYGVTRQYWSGSYPGWFDGTVFLPESTGDVQGRMQNGICFGPDGTVYTDEDYYHTIRKTTGATFGLPPAPPKQVPEPEIGYAIFPETSSPVAYTSVFIEVTNTFIFNNDTPIIIVGPSGSQTYYSFLNASNIGVVPDPTSSSPSALNGYEDGLDEQQVAQYAVANIQPYVAIKAISENNDGAPNSPIAKALFEYVCGNPSVNGDNAAQFTVTEVTSNAVVYYTTDGSDPRTNGAATAVFPSFNTNSLLYTATINLAFNNFIFKCYAAKANYQNSSVVSNFFSAANFQPNRITFGLTNGQPSSAFVARPGQFYYAPVTLLLQPGGDTIYSLQFNLSVTNKLATTHKVANNAGFNFFPMLMTAVTPTEGDHFPPEDGSWYLEIPTLIFDTNSPVMIDGVFTNTTENLLGVGWLYRTGFKYLQIGVEPEVDFDTTKQDLITYSIAHDTLFKKADGVVILGAYSFQVPTNAVVGDQYSIQAGSPSGTRDGVGDPGSDVYIQAPLTPTTINVGTPSYIVGDVAPFRWLNAGDFGDGTLDNADVMQVFQSAIELVDVPPANSDLFAAMDSSGYLGGWDSADGYYTNSGVHLNFSQTQALFDGNDTTINTNAFGDGLLDVNDLYVTFRRSLDPSLFWLERYWTNGQFVAVIATNLAFNSNSPNVVVQSSVAQTPGSTTLKTGASVKTVTQTNNASTASVNFTAGDSLVTAGQTVSIPITANIFGTYPLKIVGLNISVEALDGSPTVSNTVQFASSSALGAPTISATPYAAEYTAAWLSSTISGLSNNATIGTLTFQIPATATANSAYAIHFNHASGSPNGLGSFPNQKFTGLVTLSSRTNSTYGDGIPDSWRLRWFGTIYNALSVSNACASGDGVDNWEKYIAGVDPTIPNDFPSLHNASSLPQGYNAALTWPSVSGKHYMILRAASLFNANWSLISTNTGTGGTMEYDDSYSGKTMFYRVLITP